MCALSSLLKHLYLWILHRPSSSHKHKLQHRKQHIPPCSYQFRKNHNLCVYSDDSDESESYGLNIKWLQSVIRTWYLILTHRRAAKLASSVGVCNNCSNLHYSDYRISSNNMHDLKLTHNKLWKHWCDHQNKDHRPSCAEILYTALKWFTLNNLREEIQNFGNHW